MIQRRAFVAGMGAVMAAPHAGGAQQTGRIARLGLLSPFSAIATATALPPDLIRDSLREHGWIEGRTLRIEYRYADGRRERLDELAADLVQWNVD